MIASRVYLCFVSECISPHACLSHSHLCHCFVSHHCIVAFLAFAAFGFRDHCWFLFATSWSMSCSTFAPLSLEASPWSGGAGVSDHRNCQARLFVRHFWLFAVRQAFIALSLLLAFLSFPRFASVMPLSMGGMVLRYWLSRLLAFQKLLMFPLTRCIALFSTTDSGLVLRYSLCNHLWPCHEFGEVPRHPSALFSL